MLRQKEGDVKSPEVFSLKYPAQWPLHMSFDKPHSEAATTQGMQGKLSDA
jgi:hypothetical protein